MKRIVFLFFIFVVGFWLHATQISGKRPMTVDDDIDMVRIGDVLISPDGKMVFFSKSMANWEKNKREKTYYMVSAQGGEAFQYIGKEGGKSFSFSPDGKYLSFKRTIDKKSQLFLMPTNGGEAIQLTKHKSSVGSYKWSADGRKIYFVANEARSKAEEKRIKNGYDMIFVDEGPNGHNRGSWMNLWIIDTKSKKEIKITDEKFIINDFSVSPNGKQLLYIARYSNRRNDQGKNEIYLLDLSEKKKSQLTRNENPESTLKWAPNGKSFTYLASNDKEWLNRNNKIYIMNPFTKKYRLLSGKFEGLVNNYYWTSNSNFLLFNGQQATNSNLFKLNVKNGDFKQLTYLKGTMRIYAMSKNRKKMVYTFSDFDTPNDVYISDVMKFKPRALTNGNPWIKKDIQLAKMKIIRWRSKSDFEIEGLLHLPNNYKEGMRLPLILNIHGGPAGCFTNRFNAIYHIYAGFGFASLSPNVRGSRGYTDKLREGNTVAKGDGIGLGDYWDLINGIEYVIDLGYVDKQRIGLRGWSYGGILGGWTITQTNRFKAASLGAGVYDWTSEYGPGFNHDVRLWHIGGTPWDNPKGYRHQSALTHVKKVETPTLLIHGMKDNKDTESQSMMFFTALKDIGKVPVRYIRAPREGHGFRELRHERTRDIVEIEWMLKYILGKTWKPWERKEEKTHKIKQNN